MLKTCLLPGGVGTALLLLASAASVQAQGPTLLTTTPAANARAVPRNSSVVATFSQPLTAGSAGALKVHAMQHGGLRTAGTPAVVSGNTLSFAPARYSFAPGEQVQATVTRAAASSSGTLATGRVVQFTAAVGGTGRGVFGGNTELFVTNIIGITTGDVDGDGDLDLVAANGYANVVHVVLNGGNAGGAGGGSFSGVQNVAVGTTPNDVALADVDGDGDLDLLSTVNSPGAVSVRLNGSNASGSNTGVFSGTQSVAVGNDPRSIAMGDVDGDGDLDLVASNYNGTYVSVRLNGGNATGSNTGVFSNGTNVPVGYSPLSVVLGDVDGDGDLDLLSTSTYYGTVSVRLNGGNATGSNTGIFSGTQEVPVSSSCTNLAVGDLDNDGDLDLVAANFNSNTVGVRLNGGDATGSNTGVFSGSLTVPMAGIIGNFTLGDVDADGDLDIVATSGTNTVSVRLNGGDATGQNAGSFATGQDFTIGGLGSDLTMGDIDGDGDLDILTANVGGSMSSIRLNGGTGPLATTAGTAPAALACYPNPATGRVQLSLPPAATRAELLDALGRPVRVVPAQAGAATLDVAGLPTGLYVVRAAGQVARLVVE